MRTVTCRDLCSNELPAGSCEDNPDKVDGGGGGSFAVSPPRSTATHSGIDILAVARMNRPNDTHFHKRRVLQLAESLLQHELRERAIARRRCVTKKSTCPQQAQL